MVASLLTTSHCLDTANLVVNELVPTSNNISLAMLKGKENSHHRTIMRIVPDERVVAHVCGQFSYIRKMQSCQGKLYDEK